RRGMIRPDVVHDRRVGLHREAEPVAAAPDHEQGGEEDDREQEVRARPREDDADLLPGALAPVRVAAEAVTQLVQPLGGAAARHATDLDALECLLERLELAARAFHVAY